MYDASDISLSRDNIYRPPAISPAEIVATVRRWGIAVLPGFVSPEPLAALNAEFDRFMTSRAELPFARDEFENLANIRVVRDRLDVGAFPATGDFFSQKLMTEVADNYYGVGGYRLNGEIFVSNLSETHGPQTAPPFALHFDKINVLKFFIYLTETDENNGAMRALPGSNRRNRAVREAAMRTSAIKGIANVLPEPLTPSLPVTGPAGTMFVFDTDVCHGATAVQPGRVRRTMRGHTHSSEMLTAIGAVH
jgi:hypothetical protein